MGEVNVQRSLHLQYHDEVPSGKATNPQLLPGRHSIKGCPLLQVCVHCCVYTSGVCSLLCVYFGCVCSLLCVYFGCVFTAVCVLRVCVYFGCVFTAVCVHFGWVNCRAQIPSMCHRTWLYITFTLLISH